MSASPTAEARSRPLRWLVYADQIFYRDGDRITTNDPYWSFVIHVSQRFERTLFVARIHPEPQAGPYVCSPAAGFEPRVVPWVADLKAIRGMLLAAPRTLARLWRAIGEVDVVRVDVPHPWIPAIGLFANLRGRLLVLEDRQDGAARMIGRSKGWKRTVARLAGRFVQSSAERLGKKHLVLCTGGHVAEGYRRKGTPAHVVLNSLVPEDMVRRNRARTALPSGPPRILWIGRFECDKDPRGAIDTLAELHRRGRRDIGLDLVGTGPDESALRDRVRSLGLEESVVFHGYVRFGPGLESIYHAATVLVQSCHESEGFPKVLIEAGAMGLPVIASSVSSIPHELTDESDALLTPPRDPIARANAVERLIAEPQIYVRLSRAGRDFAAKHTLEHEAGEVVRLIEMHLASRSFRNGPRNTSRVAQSLDGVDASGTGGGQQDRRCRHGAEQDEYRQ